MRGGRERNALGARQGCGVRRSRCALDGLGGGARTIAVRPKLPVGPFYNLVLVVYVDLTFLKLLIMHQQSDLFITE